MIKGHVEEISIWKNEVPTQVIKNMQSTDNNIINAVFPVQIQDNFKNIS